MKATRKTGASRKRRETVRRIIVAANAVIAEKGFQRASLDEIAARAGLTKGAIYSNFESKDHLFWAVLGSRRIAVGSEWRHDLTVRENLRLMAQSFGSNLGDARANAGVLAEFILYALGSEDARSRWARWYEATFETATTQDKAYLRAQGMPAFPVVWTALQSMALGLYIYRALTPELVGDELVSGAIELLAGPELEADDQPKSV